MLRLDEQQYRTVRSNVCIVGSGPAGVTLARILADAGVTVLLLESGTDCETDAGRAQLVGEIAGRQYPIETSRRRVLGGSSVAWNKSMGLRARPFDEVDFQVRPNLPEWPFELSELSPFYDQACRLVGIEPISAIDLAREYPEKSHFRYSNESFRSGLFQRANPDSVRDWLLEVRNLPNVELMLQTNVVDLELNGSSVRRAIAVQNGERILIESKLFILAGGGIENARLLLASNRQSPRGIGNEHDLVGRYFMEHPHVESGFLTLADRTLVNRMGFYIRHSANGIGREGFIAPTQKTLDELALPNAGIWLKPQSVRDIAFRVMKRSALGCKRLHSAYGNVLRQSRFDIKAGLDVPLQRVLNRQPMNRQFRLEFEIEQTPLWDSRLTLADQRDEFGVPRIKLDWKVAESDWKSIRTLQNLLDVALRRERLGRVDNKFGDEIPGALIQIGNHHMGTTKMHASPRQGVVDGNCQVHGVPNLFVAGSSVFPRSSAANPTLSIMALSCRLASHLSSQLATANITGSRYEART